MKKEDFLNQDFPIDEELLEKNLSLSPARRLEILEEMRDLFWVKLPRDKKELWEKLKHLKIEELD